MYSEIFYSTLYANCQQTFNVNGWMVNILGVMGCTVSVVTTKLYHCSGAHKYFCLQFPRLCAPLRQNLPVFRYRALPTPPQVVNALTRDISVSHNALQAQILKLVPHQLSLYMSYFLLFTFLPLEIQMKYLSNLYY